MQEYDSLQEKAKLVDISLKYTRGDIIKAKEMAAGQYMDIMAVKGKFFVEKKNVAGVFIAFFNFIQEYIADVVCLLSSAQGLFEKTRVFDDWKSIYRDILAGRKGPGAVDSQNFTYYLLDSFVSYDVFPDVQEKNLDELTLAVKDILAKSFGTESVRCQIELEPSSSLALDMAGVKIDIPSGQPKEANEIAGEDERIKRVESEARYIVEGNAVLAPVRGKNISDLNPGDKIRVMLTGKDVVSDKILKLVNAYGPDGSRSSVTGRVKAKIPFGKGGFMLYAFVAKGVLAKMFEEENVKIMLDVPAEEAPTDTHFMENRMTYLMALILGLIILAGLVLLQLI
ncbi:MAG: hypothetical protein JW838_01705 [Spirochaetes bacterium]|nr:hypothetical protein [Spirochaetota bacterium]